MAILLTSMSPNGGFSAQPTVVVIRGNGFAEAPTSVYLLHPTTSGRIDLVNVALVDATEINAEVPSGGAVEATRYDLVVIFAGGTVVLQGAFLVSNAQPPAPATVSPASGWSQQPTRITVRGTGFVSLPQVMLRRGTDPDVSAENVVFIDSMTVTATVPAGLVPGPYTVLVENPDTLQGSVADGYEVSTSAPPVIDAIAPTSMPAAQAGVVTITGEFFSGAGNPAAFPGVFLSSDPANLQEIALTVTDVSVPDVNNKQTITADYDGTAGIGSYVVSVVNPDAQIDSHASLMLSSSADGKLGDAGPFADAGSALTFPRRRMGGATGADDLGNEFIFVAGGDDGTDALRNVECAPLSQFGALGTWRSTRRLNEARTGVSVVGVDHPADGSTWLFAIGGSTDGTAANALGTVERARVLTQSTTPGNVAASVAAGGALTDGAHFYRVAAVTAAGEEWLASSPVSATTGGASRTVRLTWDAVPGATAYHVYRSTGAAGNEGRVAADVPLATALTPFVDDGLASLVNTFAPASFTATEDVGNGSLAAGQWHYRVAAVTINGETAASVDASVTVGPNGAVTLDWTADASPEVLYYNLYRSESVDDVSGDRFRIADKVLAPPFTDSGLALQLAQGPTGVAIEGTQAAGGTLAPGAYTYAVTSVNGQYESLPTASSGLNLVAPNNAVTVTWDALEGVVSYNVYRDSGSGFRLIREGVLANGFVDVGLAEDPAREPGNGRIAPAQGVFAALRPGTLGRWETLALGLNTARLAHVAQVARLDDAGTTRTFVYAAVGRGAAGALLDTVERAEVSVSGVDGSLVLSAWTVETQVVPLARAFAGVALADSTTHPGIDPAADFYLYVVEGSDDGNPNPGTRNVEGAAPAAVDGSLGTWTVNGNDPPTTHYGNSAVIGSGSLYVICGIDNTGNPSVDLRRGPVQADGSVSLWADSSTKPSVGRAYQIVIVARGFLFIIGGETAGGGVTGSIEQVPF